MLTPQLVESAKRAAILVMAIVVAGLIPLYPQILSDAPLNRDAMVRAFVGGVVGALISRFGEGAFDSHRAAIGDVIKGDVAPK
jgi:hypothetical protein